MPNLGLRRSCPTNQSQRPTIARRGICCKCFLTLSLFFRSFQLYFTVVVFASSDGFNVVPTLNSFPPIWYKSLQSVTTCVIKYYFTLWLNLIFPMWFKLCHFAPYLSLFWLSTIINLFMLYSTKPAGLHIRHVYS